MARPRRIAVALVLLALVAAGLWWWWSSNQEGPPPDPRFTGAYRSGSGDLIVVTPRGGDEQRFRRYPGGLTGALFPAVTEAEPARFESGPGYSGRQPVEQVLTFEGIDLEARGGQEKSDARPTGLTWTAVGEDGEEMPAETFRALDLEEEIFTFPSGDLTLRGKLVLPDGPGPHPAVVLVHGSEAYSAVDYYSDPYLFASNGIAALAFDKRGTGGSEGEYTQSFPVLADDVGAALDALRERPAIDGERLHLAGFSQGGWVAPLAASRHGGVRSLLIGFGPLVPISEEDRWGYVYQLRRKGFGDDAIARADRVHRLFDRTLVEGDEASWDALGEAIAASRGEDWFEALAGSDSMLGFVAGTKLPQWMLNIYGRWRVAQSTPEELAQRTWDPAPTVASLDIPSLWIFGGEDSSMPTAWSVEGLEKLQAAGRPIEFLVYPEAEHGILRFEEAPGEDGAVERTILGYEPGYHERMVDWLREQSGLPSLRSPVQEPIPTREQATSAR